MKIKPNYKPAKIYEEIIFTFLFFSLTFVSLYCIFLFGPMFLGRGKAKNTSHDLLDWVIRNQWPIIIFCFILSVVILIYWIYRQRTRAEIRIINFDDKNRILKFDHDIFLKNKDITIEISYDIAKFKIKKYIDGKNIERITITLFNRNERLGIVDTDHSIWESQFPLIRDLLMEISVRFPETEVITQKPSGGYITSYLFPVKEDKKKNSADSK